MKRSYWLSTAILMVLITIALLSGTNLFNADESNEHPENITHRYQPQDETHAHTSAHGGVVRTLGDYHAELVLNKNDQDSGSRIELYISESKEQIPKTIAIKDLNAYIQNQGKLNADPITLTAEPLGGEPIGNASHFVGDKEDHLCQLGCRVSINIPIEASVYHVIFNLDPL